MADSTSAFGPVAMAPIGVTRLLNWMRNPDGGGSQNPNPNREENLDYFCFWLSFF
jgi:hypothetical protein